MITHAAGFKVYPHVAYTDMLEIVADSTSHCYGAAVPDTVEAKERFIRARMKAGHTTVIEHVSASVRITTDRGITHEIVRHRLASFTQESTRYKDYTQDKHGGNIHVLVPAAYSDIPCGVKIVQARQNGHGGCLIVEGEEYSYDHEVSVDSARWVQGMLNAETAYFLQMRAGATPEMARALLPTATKADITVTANMREWRHIFELRALGRTGRPHPQMVEVMRPLLDEFCVRFPVFFSDLV